MKFAFPATLPFLAIPLVWASSEPASNINTFDSAWDKLSDCGKSRSKLSTASKYTSTHTTADILCSPCIGDNINATSKCFGQTCACTCNAGFYSHVTRSVSQASKFAADLSAANAGNLTARVSECLSISACTDAGGSVVANNSTGYSECVCSHNGTYDYKTHTCRGLTRRKIEPTNRARSKRSTPDVSKLCPYGEEACPILPFSSAYECLDTRYELGSCGGCLYNKSNSNTTGIDCLSLPGVQGVTCYEGECIAQSCLQGFNLTGTECVKFTPLF